MTAQPSATPPAVVTEVVTATVTNPPAPEALVKVDHRLGYGALKLGMTLEEARAAGLTDLTWNSPGDGACVADDEVAISKKHGVVRITLPVDARTSTGIGVGSTYAKVKDAYQAASEYNSGWSAPVGDKAFYLFIGSSELKHFADTDKVTLIKMGSVDADCVTHLL
ncbi:hypothetical protein SK854_18035 [Lentzea sp. BCCO 10_0061]|uniref:Uncharacterized protein n=1 Tax=Lentzea sokolovensis TaxID=3095429 RepID=A0ABU4UX33_9PSEU|nr:hypothetical protein [Lentzea sp. BCCO 10_0061]MDX8144024.1 hypothetical protein [Lentzea sp. BCCO 10_0061]